MLNINTELLKVKAN